MPTVLAPSPVVPPAPPAPPAAASAGLTPEQMQQLQTARRNGRKVNRAARTAAFSGWTLATFASISILAGIFSLTSFLLGVGMAIVAWIELRGAGSIRRLDLTAPRRLALNQLSLGAMMCLYAGWGVYTTLTGPSAYADEIAAAGPQVAEMLQPMEDLQTLVSMLAYVGVGGGAALATIGAAIYYITRRRHIEDHLRQTPDWVIETLRHVG